jgi:hypothetical protein
VKRLALYFRVYINLNNDCVKTIFVSLYLFVRSQTSLDHLVLSSEARRYLTIDTYIAKRDKK